MMERIAEASPRPSARITGVVYLLYFLTAVSAEAFVGRGRLVSYDAVNLIAYVFYIVVTLLFYDLFKPVNGSLSLLAALFSLIGCANDVLGLFNLAPYKIGFLAEASLMLWLIVKGVNMQRWKEQANAATVECRTTHRLHRSCFADHRVAREQFFRPFTLFQLV